MKNTKEVNSVSILNIEDWKENFAIVGRGELLQTAVMRFKPGEESGSFGNEHPESEQTVVVFQGEIQANVADHSFIMRAGDSVLILKHVPHRFVNIAKEEAITFNAYAPPAYH